MSNRRSSGFTLVELLVTMALLALVMISLLNLLDTSTNVSKVEAALADTQENVRFAAYHIMRTARMAGGAEMPFARADGTWVTGQVQDDQTGNVSLAGGLFGSVDVAPSSDVLTLRGFFELAPFAVNRHEVDTTASTVSIRERRVAGQTGNDANDPNDDIINPMGSVPTTANALSNRGIVFIGMRQYVIGQITGSVVAGDGSVQDRALTITFGNGDGTIWETLNPARGALAAGTELDTGEPAFPVYRIGVLQTYVYYVTPDFTLMRRRAATGAPGWVDEPVAINIGTLQVSIGIDTNGDGEPDGFNPDPNVGNVTGGAAVTDMQISVLGRTPFDVRNWQEPAATFSFPNDDIDASTFDSQRGAKWRRMDVTAGIRNFSLQG